MEFLLTAGRSANTHYQTDSVRSSLDDELRDPFDDVDESALADRFADLEEPRERPARHRSGRGGARSLAEVDETSPLQDAETERGGTDAAS